VLLAALLLPACGESVTDRIDALRTSRANYLHGPPRPAPGPSALPADPVSARLLDNEAGRALLEAGEGAVPDLVRLLDDPDRQTVAAAVLAEIGGTAAAEGLLDRWRRVRATVKDACIYRVTDLATALGRRYESGDGVFYGELLHALCHAGRTVTVAVARDTEAALSECERLAAAGADLVRRERREEGGRTIELRWWPDPVETASEGIRILAACDAPEAPALAVRALRSPLRALRRAGLRSLAFLGDRADPLLPYVALLLEDPEWRDEAREQLNSLAQNLTREQRRAMARRYGERLEGSDDHPR
jgi:hypothetical protein